MKGFVDLIYGVNRAKKAFAADHPGEAIIAAGGSKSIETDEPAALEKGAKWIASQRAVIILTDKRISCGKWNIPFEDIAEAKLVKVGSLWNRGQVLMISTNDNKHYQFGMPYDKAWEEQKALPLIIEKGKVGYSWFSILLRLFVIGYLIYMFYRRYK